MKKPAIINSVDPHEGKVVVIVRSSAGAVGVALSIESNGEIEVFMPIAEAEKFSRALLDAIMCAKTIFGGY